MNFDEYEKKYQTRYAEFASVVRDILEKAIDGAEGVPRPQSIQYRSKEASHLKPKLGALGLLGSSSIEDEIKDLAGTRLIFYTNTDVDRFLNSRLIPENFEVDWDQTRIHHPTEENAKQRYQAIHYTVSLNEARTALAEYAKFKGFRCEIQIQTILMNTLNIIFSSSTGVPSKSRPRLTIGSDARRSLKTSMTPSCTLEIR